MYETASVDEVELKSTTSHILIFCNGLNLQWQRELLKAETLEPINEVLKATIIIKLNRETLIKKGDRKIETLEQNSTIEILSTVGIMREYVYALCLCGYNGQT